MTSVDPRDPNNPANARERREAARRRLEESIAEQKRQKRRRIMIVSGSTAAIMAVVAGVSTGVVLKKRADEREAARWTECAYVAADNRLPDSSTFTDPVDALEKQIAAISKDELDKLTPEKRKEFDDEVVKARAKAVEDKKQVEQRKKTIDAARGKEREVAAPAKKQLKEGTSTLTLATNVGDITITLDRAKAPCNVAALEKLAAEKFYDDTVCHRLTTGDGLKVLQCGDPTGTGMSGPGFNTPTEAPDFLAGDSPAAPNPMTGTQGPITYPRGTVAIANAGPDTGGSQFFLVYGDSQLPPSYSVVGSLDDTSVTTIENVAKEGVAPGPEATTNPGQSAPSDGRPKKDVTINTATIG